MERTRFSRVLVLLFVMGWAIIDGISGQENKEMVETGQHLPSAESFDTNMLRNVRSAEKKKKKYRRKTKNNRKGQRKKKSKKERKLSKGKNNRKDKTTKTKKTERTIKKKRCKITNKTIHLDVPHKC